MACLPPYSWEGPWYRGRMHGVGYMYTADGATRRPPSLPPSLPPCLPPSLPASLPPSLPVGPASSEPSAAPSPCRAHVGARAAQATRSALSSSTGSHKTAAAAAAAAEERGGRRRQRLLLLLLRRRGGPSGGRAPQPCPPWSSSCAARPAGQRGSKVVDCRDVVYCLSVSSTAGRTHTSQADAVDSTS
jgi:hypothetical protein